jgi:hypothetical protein
MHILSGVRVCERGFVAIFGPASALVEQAKCQEWRTSQLRARQRSIPAWLKAERNGKAEERAFSMSYARGEPDKILKSLGFLTVTFGTLET